MKLRKLNESTYIVSYDGILFQAYHSDVGGIPYLSVQDIDSGEGKYLYVTWNLSEDGQRLEIRAVSAEVIPPLLKNSAQVRKALEENGHNAGLFKEAGRERVGYYTRQPDSKVWK